ncbi:MAG: hypothetical protein PHC34_14010, partial [Candidatus Gastranaerophilales bacterium]|nr:hypothetical protein [Candidatus Gastranaerophilales bacterium]
MNTNYNIHNLINVSVDQEIKPWVLDQIEFQIGFFKVDHSCNLKHNITIYSYRKLVQSKKELAKFHDFSFDSGSFLIEDKKSFAVVKKNNGFDIFTDKPILIN